MPASMLLDLEGTTTPVSFVQEELLPFARARLRTCLATLPASELASHLEALRAEREAERDGAAPAWSEESREEALDSAARRLQWLMERSRTSTVLEAIQARIWGTGYRSGELRGRVYPDVPRAFARWRAGGRRLAVFSSGSVPAQKLLFAHSNAGDLTGFLSGYFDTTTGPRREAESYRKIAAALGAAPGDVTFLSDVAAELDAALEAGMATVLCVRRSDTPLPEGPHRAVRSFDAVD